jgi:CRP-like cAMP-binding protein
VKYDGEVLNTAISPADCAFYVVEIEIQSKELYENVPEFTDSRLEKFHPSDLRFLLNSNLFVSLSEQATCALFNAFSPVRVKAGERFISQGDDGDNCYMIREGTCIVTTEKDGVTYGISRLRVGDIVGEMALLTGEPRTADVHAETDMTLWSLPRQEFDSLCENYRDLREFLTELTTCRFSSERVAPERTIGKYWISEKIGRGGWSVVYKGVHMMLSRPVAVKMLKHSMAMAPEFAERFKREAKVIASLEHPNIVRVYDIEERYKTIFIIMEYIEGTPLDYLLKKEPRMSLDRIVGIILQTCGGLLYAHERGIVHQDIKPANIFIQPDYGVKIVDFGLACTPGVDELGLAGTVYYMAPEQIEGEAVDSRTDIYSLGITAYEMITGRRPYPEDDIGRLMHSHVHEDIPDPRLAVPDLPDELSRFVIRATRRQATDRYSSVQEVIRELQPLAGRIGAAKYTAGQRRQRMIGFLLVYSDEHQHKVDLSIERLYKELSKIGVVCRTTEVKEL